MPFSWRGKESATLRRLVVSELTEQHGKCSSCGDDCGSASGCRGRSRKVAVGGYKYRQDAGVNTTAYTDTETEPVTITGAHIIHALRITWN